MHARMHPSMHSYVHHHTFTFKQIINRYLLIRSKKHTQPHFGDFFCKQTASGTSFIHKPSRLGDTCLRLARVSVSLAKLPDLWGPRSPRSWKSLLELHGYLWFLMVIYGYGWFYLWFLMVFIWLLMVIYYQFRRIAFCCILHKWW